MTLLNEDILVRVCLFIENEFEGLMNENNTRRKLELKGRDFFVCPQFIEIWIFHQMKLNKLRNSFSFEINFFLNEIIIIQTSFYTFTF